MVSADAGPPAQRSAMLIEPPGHPFEVVNLFCQLLELAGNVQHEPTPFRIGHDFSTNPRFGGLLQESRLGHRLLRLLNLSRNPAWAILSWSRSISA